MIKDTEKVMVEKKEKVEEKGGRERPEEREGGEKGNKEDKAKVN